MLWRDAAGERAGFLYIARLDERATCLERRGDDALSRHVAEQAMDGRFNRVQMRAIGREQQRLRVLVVLGLREKVHREPFRRGAAIGDDENLRWAGNHVDADAAKHLALRFGDIGISRADDLVDAGNRTRAIRERRHCLRAANADDAIDARERRGGEHQRIRIRTHHDDLAHAGHLGGHSVHEDGGGIRRLAARHVDADTVEGRDALPEARAVGLGVFPGILRLPLMERADPAVRRP